MMKIEKAPVPLIVPNPDDPRLTERVVGIDQTGARTEIKVPVERTEEIIRIIWEVEKRISTQVVIGVGVRCDSDGEEKIVLPILEKLGYNPQRAKTNIGLGRKVIRDLTNAAPVAQPKEMVNA